MIKKQAEQLEAVRILKEWGLVDGSTVFAKVNKVSASGMSRNVGLYIVIDGNIKDISYWAAAALEWPHKDGYNGGVRVGGVGMDMLFHTVYSLSYAMGYGSLNQNNHEMHVKYNDYLEDCVECRNSKRVSPQEPIGLKYRQL